MRPSAWSRPTASPTTAASGAGEGTGSRPEDGAPDRRASESAPRTGNTRIARVLLVDDDPGLLFPVGMLVRDALGPASIVDQEYFGTRGLVRAEAGSYDLILLDLRLPDIDGLAVLKLLKEDARTRSVPVIVVTGESRWETLGTCVDAGAQTYLFKPLRPEKFVPAVRKAIGDR